jgi:hypothetical protein
LAQVVLRHVPAAELRFQNCLSLRVSSELSVQGLCYGFPCNIILCGPKPPTQNDNIGAGQSSKDLLSDTTHIVPYHRLMVAVDAQFGQSLPQELCVAVQDLPKEQLCANGDYFCNCCQDNTS